MAYRLFYTKRKKMKLLDTSNKNFNKEFAQVLKRGKMDIKSASIVVQKILDEIINDGDNAILKHIASFDKWNPKKFSEVKISINECKNAYKELDSTLKSALHTAFERIYAYHQKQKGKTWIDIEKNGTLLGSKLTPMDRAGLYIPGGKAAYPSSLLMNAIPAIVAGVDSIVVCTPAVENSINKTLLAAMHLCGIKEAYKIGGASAIGLMAYGSQSVKKVDMISGPGNIYVATAKKLVFGEVSIDMIAGPSEIGIIADEFANPTYIAYDLLSQAEHDEMASSILLTHSQMILDSVKNEIYRILPDLKREKIASKSIENRAVLIKTTNLQESIKLSNEIAPEHLEVLVNNPFDTLPLIRHAGAIFLGEYSTEPIGDYLAGPNHTLPTGGSAKFFSPLSVEHFMKKSSIISFSRQAMKELGKECANLAECEQLDAHKKAVLARLDSIKLDV